MKIFSLRKYFEYLLKYFWDFLSCFLIPDEIILFTFRHLCRCEISVAFMSITKLIPFSLYSFKYFCMIEIDTWSSIVIQGFDFIFSFHLLSFFSGILFRKSKIIVVHRLHVTNLLQNSLEKLFIIGKSQS